MARQRVYMIDGEVLDANDPDALEISEAVEMAGAIRDRAEGGTQAAVLNIELSAGERRESIDLVAEHRRHTEAKALAGRLRERFGR